MGRISANGVDIDMFSVGKDEDYIKLALQGVEAEIDSRGWDNRPFVFWIATIEKGIMLGELPLPDSVYQAMSDTLPGFVDWCARDERARAHLKTILPNDGFLGLIFVMEGWMVPPPDEGAPPEAHAAYQEACENHTFHEHPDRVETRTGHLVLTTGRKLGIIRVRGEVPETHDEGLGGVIPQAIDQFLWVCDSIAPHNELEEITFDGQEPEVGETAEG